VGQKPDDWNTISLCRDHHAEQHRIGEQSFEKRHGIDMRRLADTFSMVSPRATQIKIEKAARNV
jgi:hypothetical protein